MNAIKVSMSSAVALLLGLAVVAPATGAVGDGPFPWPQWGGPGRDFRVVDAPPLVETFPEAGPKAVWQRELGEGYASFVCDGPRLFTMLRRDASAEEVVVALDRASGKTLWEYAYPAPIEADMNVEHGPGPHATPLLCGETIVTVGATVKVHCLSRETGKLVWSKDLRKEFGATHLKRGYCASPLLVGGQVVLPIGGEGQAVIALSVRDGSVVWKNHTFGWCYSSPILVDVGGRQEIVVYHHVAVDGVDPKTGAMLWSIPHRGQTLVNVCTPVYDADSGRLFVSSGYGLGSLGIDLKREGETATAKQAWANPRMQIHHGNAVLVDGVVYGSSGHGPALFSAIDLGSGEMIFRERGIGKATCLFADGKLLVLDMEGVLTLVDVRSRPKELEILGRAEVLEPNAWTVPILVDGVLYLRDRKQALALDLRASLSSGARPAVEERGGERAERSWRHEGAGQEVAGTIEQDGARR